MRQVTLRSGKGYTTPGLFFHLHSAKYDPQVIFDANENYPRDPNHADGIRSIDGFLIETRNFETMSKKLNLDTQTLTDKRSIPDRVLIVDPALDIVIRGSESDKEQMFKTELFDPKFKEKILEISHNNQLTTNQKLDRVVNEAYPFLDARTIRDLIQFQLDARADFIVPPVVPITSSRQIEKQTAKAKEMIRQTHVWINSVFNRYQDNIDVMNLLTINASALNAENFNSLIGVALTYSPTHLGIRLVNFSTSNDAHRNALAAFLNQLHEAMKLNNLVIPLHMINFDHLGYTTYCLGAQTVTMPIGTDPYFYGIRQPTGEAPEHDGAYYRIKDMSISRYKDFRSELVEDNYKLPCYCEACEGQTLLDVLKSYKDWNYFRRVHEVLARDIEIKQFRDSKVPLCRAIHDQLARSKKSNYANVIPQAPIVMV